MDYSRIPTELKNLKQWVCAWDRERNSNVRGWNKNIGM